MHFATIVLRVYRDRVNADTHTRYYTSMKYVMRIPRACRNMNRVECEYLIIMRERNCFRSFVFILSKDKQRYLDGILSFDPYANKPFNMTFFLHLLQNIAPVFSFLSFFIIRWEPPKWAILKLLLARCVPSIIPFPNNTRVQNERLSACTWYFLVHFVILLCVFFFLHHVLGNFFLIYQSNVILISIFSLVFMRTYILYISNGASVSCVYFFISVERAFMI